MYQPVEAGLAGLIEAVNVGGVISTFRCETAASVEVLPAMSVTVLETDWSLPSDSGTDPGQAPPAKPELPVSEQVKLMVGAPVLLLYQPVESGFVGFTLAVIVGALVSTFMPVGPAVAVFPATSVMVLEADWFAPSVKINGDGQDPLMPEVASEQV